MTYCGVDRSGAALCKDTKAKTKKTAQNSSVCPGSTTASARSGLHTATAEISPLDVSLLGRIYAEALLDAHDISEVRSVLEQQGHVDLVAHCLTRVLLERTEELRDKIGMTTEVSLATLRGEHWKVEIHPFFTAARRQTPSHCG